eukprot:m.477734 g.477734  ORF g.477734 m.477734 type:complete len:343 (-) comp20929_c0_seq1:74-1102(-)
MSDVAKVLSGTAVKTEEVDKVATKYTDMFDESKGGSVEERKGNYAAVVNAYYDLATDFYEYGWGQSFHFANRAPTETLAQAIARHEHYLALKLQVGHGDKVLDCGCGVGGPAREIARFSGCNVVGLNNNAYQVQRATKHTKDQKLSDQVSFIKGDFMKIDAEDNSFDGVYAIEATCHAPEKTGVYGEIFRVLKPGQRFACYEWCMTDKYERDNEAHNEIKHGIEVGDGLPDLDTIADSLAALRAVGFEVLESRDMAKDAGEGTIPWYEPLDAKWSLSNFRQTHVGRWITHKLVNVLEFMRLAPKGTVKTHDFLIQAADSLAAGGKQDIFTPMCFFVARKPLN